MLISKSRTYENIRIAMLWIDATGYALDSVSSIESILHDRLWSGFVGKTSSLSAPQYSHLKSCVYPENSAPYDISKAVIQTLEDFKPDVFIGAGWSITAIPQVAKAMRRLNIPTVCAADTPWLGTFRQTARCLLGRRFIHSCYDAIMIPGATGMPFAKLCGYNGQHIWYNMNTGDSLLFSRNTGQRLEVARKEQVWPNQFVFVGRLVEEKNVRGLISAYELYRKSVINPWPLVVIGDGPLRDLVKNVEKIEWKGWLEASEISDILSKSGCFILPSIYEPWGVVVHEACCSGLPLILSINTGAGADLLRDGFNGRYVDPNSPDHIASMMQWVANHGKQWELGYNSYLLSNQFSPSLWSKNIISRSLELVNSSF